MPEIKLQPIARIRKAARIPAMREPIIEQLIERLNDPTDENLDEAKQIAAIIREVV